MDDVTNPKFYSKDELEALAWDENYLEQIVIHGPGIGFTAAEIAETKADAQRRIWTNREWLKAMKKVTVDAIAYAEHSARGNSNTDFPMPGVPVFTDVPQPRPPGQLKRMFKVTDRIKLSEGYTDEGLGTIFRIVNPVKSKPRNDRPYPDYFLDIIEGEYRKLLRIDFIKLRHDAVYIEGRFFGGPWFFIAIDNAKPHLYEYVLPDTNVPVVFEVRMRWWDKGEAHGEWSPVKSILMIPRKSARASRVGEGDGDAGSFPFFSENR